MAQWGSLLAGLWSEQIAASHLNRVPAPPPIPFVPAAFLSLHFPPHWCGEGGFQQSEGGRVKYSNVPVWITVWNMLGFFTDNFQWVASASGLKTNQVCDAERPYIILWLVQSWNVVYTPFYKLFITLFILKQDSKSSKVTHFLPNVCPWQTRSTVYMTVLISPCQRQFLLFCIQHSSCPRAFGRATVQSELWGILDPQDFCDFAVLPYKCSAAAATTPMAPVWL